MEDTNPQGSATVDNAAAKIFGMLEPEQPEGQAEELEGSTASHLGDRVAASRFGEPEHRVRPADAGDVPRGVCHRVLRQLADHLLEVFEIEGRERRVAGCRSHLAASSDSRLEPDNAAVGGSPVTQEEALVLLLGKRIGDLTGQVVGQVDDAVFGDLARHATHGRQLASRQSDSVPVLVACRQLCNTQFLLNYHLVKQILDPEQFLSML